MTEWLMPRSASPLRPPTVPGTLRGAVQSPAMTLEPRTLGAVVSMVLTLIMLKVHATDVIGLCL